MKLSKEYKMEMIKSFKTQLKNMGLSDKSVGFFIRAFHVNCPGYFIVIMLYCSKIANIILLIFLAGALYSFIVCDGCFLSMLENSLDKEDITIIDPLLEICDLEVNTKNRIDVSIIIAMFYIALSLMIFMVRFIIPCLSE